LNYWRANEFKANQVAVVIGLVQSIVINHYSSMILTLFIDQYSAWCLHDGDHKTLKRGAVNWNKQLSWKMKTELEIPFQIIAGEEENSIPNSENSKVDQGTR
jgi:hypothetical protein